MADPRQPASPEPSAPPPDRLQRWFAAEVHAAEQDVTRGLVTVARPSMRRGRLGRGFLGGAVAASGVALLLVVALMSGFLGGAVGPSPSAGTGPTATAASATASSSGVLYADGIPMTFDGQPVLRPTQAAAHAAASTDASSFLIGGWITSWFPYTGCPRPSGSEADQVLAGGLCAAYLTESPVTDETGPVQLHFRAPVTGWYGAGPVILRVHTHDPLATACAAATQDTCAHTIVVDALVWNGPTLGPDGLPTWIEGQPTFSVPEALVMLAHNTSATRLFVRGWYAGWALPCPYIPATVPPTPGSSLLPDDCQPSILRAAPIPLGQDHAIASDLNLTLGPGVDAPPIGQVVLEVHEHDPAAAECDPSIRAACDAAVIVDAILWTGGTGVSSTPHPSPSATEDIPTSIDGELVLRGQAFLDRVAQATDTTTFLVGGWTPATPEVYFCPMIPAPSPGVSFDPAAESLCGGLWFLDAPGDPQGSLMGSPPWVADRIAVVTTVPAWGAPFVMRVHVEVPAASCRASDQTACQRAVVEDSLVWQGLAPSR